MLAFILVVLWLPLEIHLLIPHNVCGARRAICFILNYLLFLVISLIGKSYGEAILLIALPLLAVIAYYGLKCKKIELLYIPLSYILIALFNNLVSYAMEEIYQISAQEITEPPYLYYFEIAVTILLIFTGIVLRKLLVNVKALLATKYKKVSIILISGNVILCMIVFLINNWAARINNFPAEVEKTNMLIFSIYTAMLFLITAIVLKVFRDKEEMEREKQQYENIKEYSAQIENMYTNLRAFKHDYINILTAMSGYFKEKNYEGVERYFNENILTTRDKLERDNYRLNQLKNIKDLALKGVISSKLICAHEMGIDIYIDVLDLIEHISMKEIDLSRILGVFLDNAVEAALESEEKEIKFNMIKEDKHIAIIIMNTFVNHNFPIAKLEQEGFSTKGENRGLGLANVKKILQSYDNVYKTTQIQDGYFMQKLEIVDTK